MSGSGMLFACSRCFSRHPFEELSPGQQLCKECRGSFPVVKCTFCRSEFQQTSKGSTSTICKKCEQNVKLYRKPTACEYCNIIAAFIGNKCQRCTNSEKRYGPPVTCEQCKQKCAFDRKDEDKKVDGKLLCWLCTLSYKRALAKTKQNVQDRRDHQRLTRERERAAKHREQAGRYSPSRHASANSNSANSNSTSNSKSVSDNNTSVIPPLEDFGSHERSERHDRSHDRGHDRSHDRHNRHDRHDRHGQDRPRSHNKRPQRADVTKLPPPSTDGKDSIDGPPAKVPRPAAARVDPHDPEHVVAMTQLKEKIVSLNKQLSMKDQQLLAKDKMITELKAKHFTVENELRNRMLASERDFKSKSEMMSSKIKNLQKEVATLSKMKNTPKSERRKVVEINDKERIRTVDAKEYLKEKIRKMEKNDSDQKDTDSEKEDTRKSRNLINSDDEDDSKDVDMKVITIKDEGEVGKLKNGERENGEEKKNGDNESVNDIEMGGESKVHIKEEIETIVKKEEKSTEDQDSVKDDSDKESDNESAQKDHSSDKESAKGDSDKESDEESTKKDHSSDKESRKGDSDKESDDESTKKDCSSDKESTKADSDKDSDKESDKDSDKDSDRDSDKESDKDSEKESDKDSDSDSDA